MIYEEIFRALAQRGVRYVVVGGVALVLHGVVRFTADLDLLVHLEEKNLEKFIAAMQELGYRPKIPVIAEDLVDSKKRDQWMQEKGLQVFSFYNPEKPIILVDVFVKEPIEFGVVDRDKLVVEAGGVKIPVISVEHLKELKRISGRPQDLTDLQALQDLQQEEEES